jgi:hypothetical protein
MLAAEGTSILRNIYSINRGYEELVERLNSLGAKISVSQTRRNLTCPPTGFYFAKILPIWGDMPL